MDAELKAKWVKALRSNEYQQARGELTRDGGYCCLGVLCLVAGLGTDREETNDDYKPIFDLVGGWEVSAALSMRNDGTCGVKPHSFDEIADYIEKNL